MAKRLPTNKTAKMNRNQKLEKAGKTINYEKEDPEKWKQFHAGRPCRGKELKELLDAGHVPSPTRWVDRDRNEFKRRAGNPDNVPLGLKSRLVGRGDLENLDGVRTDSPMMSQLDFQFCSKQRIEN